MATSTVLSNPVVTVNNVDITDNVTSAVFHQMITQLRATSFGDSAEKYTAGLGDHSVELEVYQSFAATETWVTLKALVGTTTTVKVKATSRRQRDESRACTDGGLSCRAADEFCPGRIDHGQRGFHRRHLLRSHQRLTAPKKKVARHASNFAL